MSKMVNLNDLGQTRIPDRAELTLGDYLQQYNAAYERIARRLVDAARVVREIEPRFFEVRRGGLELRVREGQETQSATQAVMETEFSNLLYGNYKDHPKLETQIPKNQLYKLIRDLSSLKNELDSRFTHGVRPFDGFSPAPLAQFECHIDGVKDGRLKESILYGANVTREDREGQKDNEFYIPDAGFGKSLSIEMGVDPDAVRNPDSNVYQVNKRLATLDLSESGSRIPLGVVRLAIMDRVLQQLVKVIYERDTSAKERISQLGLLGSQTEFKPNS